MPYTLVYAGRRINGDSLNHCYIDEQTTEEYFAAPLSSLIFFKKQLGLPHGIGTIIQCEKTTTGVVGPYKVLGKVKDVGSLSVKVVSDAIEYKKRQQQKEHAPGHVDDLIKLVKDSARTRTERNNLALYIYNKLIC